MAVMNKTAINIVEQVSRGTVGHHLGMCPGMVELGHILVPFLILWRTRLFSKLTLLIYTPIQYLRDLLSSHQPQHLLLSFIFLIIACSELSEVVSKSCFSMSLLIS